MTERERWIVYPLLFLALGAALRDKLFDRTTSRSIVCQELTVIDEQPLGREPVLLARIGRTESVSSGGTKPVGYLLLNGQLEIVDGDPLGHRLVPILATVGPANQPHGASAGGYFRLNGQLVVDGGINARHYAYQGIPLIPMLQSVPGAALPDLWRALQHAFQAGSTEQPPPKPLADPPQKQ